MRRFGRLLPLPGLAAPSPWTDFWVRVRYWMAGGVPPPTSNPRGILAYRNPASQRLTVGGKEACKNFFFKGVTIKISRGSLFQTHLSICAAAKGDGGSFACISGGVTHEHHFVSPREAACPPTSHCCSGTAGIKWTNSVSLRKDSPHPSPWSLSRSLCRLGTLPLIVTLLT